jgi:hypothetical protein
MIKLTRSELLWNIRALGMAIAKAKEQKNENLAHEFEELLLKYEQQASGEGTMFELTQAT